MRLITGMSFLVVLVLILAMRWPMEVARAESRSETVAVSRVVADFQMKSFLESLGIQEWRTVGSGPAHEVPPLARSPITARRMVARCKVPQELRGFWTRRFQEACENWLKKYSADVKGQEGASSSWSEGLEDSGEIHCPRRFYAVDGIHGIADMETIMDRRGNAVVIISFLEMR